jgi:hypothetical protein
MVRSCSGCGPAEQKARHVQKVLSKQRNTSIELSRQGSEEKAAAAAAAAHLSLSLSLSRSLSGSLNRPSPANLHAASLVEARARRVPLRAFFAAAAHVGYRKRRAAPQQREAVGVEGRFARGAVLLARRTREEKGQGGR